MNRIKKKIPSRLGLQVQLANEQLLLLPESSTLPVVAVDGVEPQVGPIRDGVLFEEGLAGEGPGDDGVGGSEERCPQPSGVDRAGDLTVKPEFVDQQLLVVARCL